jgi:hypothetical protein
MSVQLPNMFPQSVTLGTQETVAVLLNITDVAEVVINVLLSVSVCSNIPGYTVPVCYISEGDTRKTVESCLSYLRSQRGGVPETDAQVWRRVPAESGKTRQ